MYGLMLAEITIKAIALCVILKLVAKHEADYSFHSAFMAAAIISIGTGFIQLYYGDNPAALVPAMLLASIFAVWVLMKVTWVGVNKGIIVMLLFLVVHAAIVGLAALALRLLRVSP